MNFLLEEEFYTKDFYVSCFYLNKEEETKSEIRKIEDGYEDEKDSTLRSKYRKKLNELNEMLGFYKNL